MWYNNNPGVYLLSPLSGIYRLVIALRRGLYQCGVFKTTHFDVPVIIVGNITVGGTGKTPLISTLAKFLQSQGYHPGLVSRGYGGRAARYPLEVTAGSDPRETGDEAVMLAQQTGLPMVVAPNRVAAVKKLLADHNVDVVLSDDGLQHLALGRQVEIAVIDGERGLGNGFCLPAGPLRESWKRLQSVDFIVVNGKGQGEHGMHMYLVPGPLQPLKTSTVTGPTSGKIHAVAGIGHPQRFFNTLRQLGFDVIAHPFPDHHKFKPKDFDFKDDLPIIMTTKDAVKCQTFAKSNWWVLPITAKIPLRLGQKLLQKLNKSGKVWSISASQSQPGSTTSDASNHS